jgi:hypothetical protein
MTRRWLLMVGLVALVLALALTGVLSMLGAREMAEVLPLPPDTVPLPPLAGLSAGAEIGPPEAMIVPSAASAVTETHASAVAVQPATAILQSGLDGYEGCSDTYIQFLRPTDNFCESPELYVVTSNKAATLLRFDLTDLPENVRGLTSGAVVVEATLELYAAQGNEGAVTGIYLPRGHWDPCQVTWNTPWAEPGADGLSDREYDARVERSMPQATGWIAFDVTELVQYWLREPTQNCGVIIKSFDVNVPSQYIFFSSDHSHQDMRPKLTIKYEPALPMAAPTSTSDETSTPIPGPTAAPMQTAMPSTTSVPTATLALPLSTPVVELHWQDQMSIGSSYPVRVAFRPDTTQASSGPSELYLLSVYAQVTAPTFDIAPNSPAEQVLEQPEDVLAWSWQVEPRMLGSQMLSFDLLFRWTPATSAVPSGTTDSGTWYQTRMIRIVRPFRYWTLVTVLRNLLLSAGLVCLVGWHFLGRRTRARSPGD